jgi:hypothetical protein
MRMCFTRYLLPLCLALPGCGDETEGAGARTLEAAGGPDSIVLPASTVELRVRVREDGAPARNVRVRWTADSGRLSWPESVTGPDGLASVTWELPRLEVASFHPRATPGRQRARAALVAGVSLTFEVRAEPFRVDQMDAGYELGCGVRAGEVYCWDGWGDSQPPRRLDAAGAGVARQVAITSDRLCILFDAGRVACGQYPQALEPVTGAPPLQSITAAGNRICGLASDRTAWCWRLRPGDVPAANQVGSQAFDELAGGGDLAGQSHVCGRADTMVWCWGSNGRGQLGNGTTDDSEVPVPVSGGHDFVSLRAGHDGACGVTRKLGVWCWGTEMTPVTAREPLLVGLPGVTGPRIELGEFGGWVLDRGATVEWSRGEVRPTDALLDQLDIVEFASDFKNLCVRTREGFVYCSFAAGSSRLWPNELVALQLPESP